MHDMCPALILNISIDFQSRVILELFPTFKSSTFQSHFKDTLVIFKILSEFWSKSNESFSNFDEIQYSSNDPKITMVTLIEWAPKDFMESDNLISGQFIKTINLIKVSRWLWYPYWKVFEAILLNFEMIFMGMIFIGFMG